MVRRRTGPPCRSEMPRREHGTARLLRVTPNSFGDLLPVIAFGQQRRDAGIHFFCDAWFCHLLGWSWVLGL